MNFEILEKLEEVYGEVYTFGSNKDGEVFVNASKTKIVFEEDDTYELVRDRLLKGKFIKKIKVV